MTILALDLGTRTGVARGSAGCAPSDLTFETWEMPRGGGRDLSGFASVFMTTFKRSLVDVEIVIFEQPILAGIKNADVVRRFYGMAFVIEGVCALRKIPCFEANISALKADFAGTGKASKEQMILSANRRGFRVTDEHQADAAACWLHVVARRFPKELPKYDPDFRAFHRRAGE